MARTDDVEIRPFRRIDRDQVADLVNLHARAVVPGVTAPVHAVLAQFESEPGEVLVDPWVAERVALVGLRGGSVAAAALVVRYHDDDAVGKHLRGAGELRWLLFRPESSWWPGTERVAQALLDAVLGFLARATVKKVLVDGALPVPGVYGVPEPWTHVRRLLARAGFEPGERVEQLWLADVAEVVAPAGPDLVVTREVGPLGTRFTTTDGAVEGFVEVEEHLGGPDRIAPRERWAELADIHVDESRRRHGVGRGLLAAAAAWLRLGRVEHLLAITGAGTEADHAGPAFLAACGFVPLTRTTRSWTLSRR